MTHRAINFGPLATNVLDWVDRPGLTMPNGDSVKVTRDRMDFVIIIGANYPKFIGLSNSEASYILNACEVGLATVLVGE